MPNYRLLFAIAIWQFCAVGSLHCSGSSAHYVVDKWTTDEGLPQNSVIALTQTRDGYLWVGTGNGLARFDGIHFKTFDDTPGMENAKINKLFEDSHTNLWVGTDTASLALVKDGNVTFPDIVTDRSQAKLVTVCEEPSGVWLFTENGQVCRYQEGKVDVRINDCVGLVTDNSGLVWIGTPSGRVVALGPMSRSTGSSLPVAYDFAIGKLDFMLASKRGGYWLLANGRIQKRQGAGVVSELEPYPKFGEARIVAACEDREGNLVVGTYGNGVWWFNSEGKATQLQGLSHSFIFSLAMDREGSLWVGTDGGGLNRVKQQVFDVPDRSRVLTVQSVSEDAEGGLWYGINNGGVGLRKNGTNQEFGEREGLANPYVRSVFVDQQQRVWVGTDGGGLFRLEEKTFQPAPGAEAVNSHISAIFQDRKGLLWVGTRDGLACWNENKWRIFTTADGLSTNAVQSIADDPQGNLWIGTSGGGLNCLREGRFSFFTKTNGLPNNDVSSLYVDRNGVVWVATSGGLARFHQGKWTRYTKNEGLINNRIFYLIEDDHGYLWIGSTAGLMRVEKKALDDYANGSRKTLPFRAYGQPDGLPTGECTSGSQPAACQTRAGLLWFPTIKGLASLDPALLNPNTNPPPVVIESVRIDGQLQTPATLRAPPPRSVTVPADKESLDIDYTSLNLSAPHKGRFRYRLEPFESGWTEQPGDIRTAHYSKLPPGHFTFQVVACNEDEVCNETGSSLAVTVLPPFWRTGWFLTVTTVCLLGMIVGSVHFISTQKLHRQLETLRQQEALEKERARIARDLHDQLGANLTQVALLGEMAETDKNIPDEVESHAQQICQTARDTTRALDEIVWTVNPSNDTLDGLINYVCKYAQEYLAVAGLRYRLDVPGQLPATPISPELRHNVFLASKEAITNVVRHAKATAASIRLRLEPNRFTLEIQDDGRGVGGMDPKAARLRNGLSNMRKRMEDVGGEFSISSAPEGGAVVRLSAPLDGDRSPNTAPRT